jgi:hypothetical protein
MSKKVGSIEKVNFVNICGEIEAKVDTGAWRTSLHVDKVYLKNNNLLFHIDDRVYVYKKYKTVNVKSSFGKTQIRYSIKTTIKLGEYLYNVSISLSNRKSMKYKCLIGRRFLYRNKFLVDVNKKFINK